LIKKLSKQKTIKTNQKQTINSQEQTSQNVKVKISKLYAIGQLQKIQKQTTQKVK